MGRAEFTASWQGSKGMLIYRDGHFESNYSAQSTKAFFGS